MSFLLIGFFCVLKTYPEAPSFRIGVVRSFNFRLLPFKTLLAELTHYIISTKMNLTSLVFLPML
jgi:hypothetical protein